ncbi:MAG: putative sensor protein [Solirubrobacterales bacterium]|nr:putative sensor protein [Solirubrobacterales bacterium]
MKRLETERDVSRGLLEALFRDSGIGAAFFDVEGRYERINPRLAALHRLTPEEHVGLTLEEVVPDIAPAIRARLDLAIAKGETLTTEITGEMPAEPGVRRTWTANFVPVRDETDEIIGCAVMVSDVTERKRAEDRTAFIAEAATLLDTSLDLETTVRTMCRIAVPRLADWCAIDLLDADGVIRRAAAAHTDPVREQAAWDLARRWPPGLEDPTGVGAVVRTGRSDFHPEVHPEMAEAAAKDEEHLAMIRALDVRAALIVPLRARGRVFGAMAFACAESARKLSDDDRRLIEELTDRAALAVDNARLHTELQRTTEAQRFLAEAGRVLSASLDWETTCQTVAHLATTGFADWCGVHAIDTSGELRTVASAHVNAEKLLLLDELQHGYPIDGRDGYVGAALGANEPRLVAHVDDQLRVAVARDDEHLRLLRELDARSVILAPMVARGRAVGAIMFAITEDDRQYGAEDVALAAELARRAAVAADNARLYSDRSRVARTLQRSLLPARLPDVPGVDIAPLYHAAGDQVAGDFYDVFALPGDAWGLMIGDVCGKGATAAALTALARHTVRAAAAYEPGAAGVLRALHDAVLAEDTEMRFLTAAFLRLTRGDDGWLRGTAAVGGHLPPVIVRAGGEAERVAGTGPLLGVLAGIEIGERSVELGPGDVLVLATDGVTEAGAPGDALGEARLMELVRAGAGESAAALAEAIAEAALARQPGRLRDDVTLLVVRVLGEPGS